MILYSMFLTNLVTIASRKICLNRCRDNTSSHLLLHDLARCILEVYLLGVSDDLTEETLHIGGVLAEGREILHHPPDGNQLPFRPVIRVLLHHPDYVDWNV